MELNQQQRHAALSDLATTPTKYWLRKQPGGNRRLHDLHTQCCSVNLVQPSCGPVRNDGDRLLLLFQVALQHGLACIIASFVQDVCLAQQGSSDAVETQMRDGKFVNDWATMKLQHYNNMIKECIRELPTSQARLRSGSAPGSDSQQVAGSKLLSASAQLRGLAAVFQVLGSASEGQAGARAEGAQRAAQGEARQVEGLLQAAKVLSFLGSVSLSDSRHASRADWQRKLNQARYRSGGPLFVDVLLAEVKAQVLNQPMAYPFQSLEALVQAVFLEPAAGLAGWRSKLGLLLYHLLDSGTAGPDQVEHFERYFALSSGQVTEWRCLWKLDQAAVGDQAAAAALEQAAQTLPGVATPGTPFRAVERLENLGRPQAALAVLQARQGSSSGALPTSEGLEAAQVGVRLLLRCGLLPEAYAEVRQRCSALPPTERRQQLEDLLVAMLEWAAARDKERTGGEPSLLAAALTFPFDGLEEQVVHGWLRSKAAQGSGVALLLPLYFLQRSRLVEALHAYQELQQSGAAQGHTEALQQLQQLMAAAAALVPSVQRNLQVLPEDGSRPAISTGAHLKEAAHGLTTSVAPAVAVRPTGQSPAPLVQPPWSSPSEDTCQQQPEVVAYMDAQPANEQHPRFTLMSGNQLQATDAGAASFDVLVQSAQHEQQANPGIFPPAANGIRRGGTPWRDSKKLKG